MSEKKINYKYSLYLEEWTESQGFQVIDQIVLTEQLEFPTAVTKYRRLKELLEKEDFTYE